MLGIRGWLIVTGVVHGFLYVVAPPHSDNPALIALSIWLTIALFAPRRSKDGDPGDRSGRLPVSRS